MRQGLTAAIPEHGSSALPAAVFDVQEVQQAVRPFPAEGDRAAGPVVLPGHEHPQVCKTEDFRLQVLDQVPRPAAAEADIPHAGDLLRCDARDPRPGVVQAGDGGHQDHQDVRGLHGQAADGVPQPARVDEIEAGRIVQGDGRVEARGVVRRRFVEEDDVPRPRLVGVIRMAVGVRQPPRFGASSIDGPQGGVDDGAHGEGDFLRGRRQPGGSAPDGSALKDGLPFHRSCSLLQGFGKAAGCLGNVASLLPDRHRAVWPGSSSRKNAPVYPKKNGEPRREIWYVQRERIAREVLR